MTEEYQPTVKRKHPLPGMCWVWPIGGVFLLYLGSVYLWIFNQRLRPPADVAEKYPPDHPAWNTFLYMGIVGVITGIGYSWLWHRFAIKRSFTRKTWHMGVGLLLTGAAFLFFTGWPVPAVVYLLVLAVWAQGFTRQHFDKL